MEVGQKIKRLRLQMDLTLEELASRSELSKGFLSQVERDLTSPSIATLSDIVEALGVDLATFFSKEEAEKIVFKEDDYFIDDQEEYSIQWIVPNAQKNEMEPMIITIKPEGKSQVVLPHEGQEFGYVLKGDIILKRNMQQHHLSKNQTFYVNGKHEHVLVNNSDEEAVILWVSNPPIF